MKIRLLRKLLNCEDGYIFQFSEYKNGPAICIGSSYVGNLLEVPVDNPRILMALDKTPDTLNKDLRLIYDGLSGLIESGEIKQIFEGDDEVPNGVPVFWESKDQIRESVTEDVCWPNITADGDLIHDNTHFKTKAEALSYAIKSETYHIKSCNESISDIEDRLKRMVERRDKAMATRKRFRKERSELPSKIKTAAETGE